jgi:hypothetical protein
MHDARALKNPWGVLGPVSCDRLAFGKQHMHGAHVYVHSTAVRESRWLLRVYAHAGAPRARESGPGRQGAKGGVCARPPGGAGGVICPVYGGSQLCPFRVAGPSRDAHHGSSRS